MGKPQGQGAVLIICVKMFTWERIYAAEKQERKQRNVVRWLVPKICKKFFLAVPFFSGLNAPIVLYVQTARALKCFQMPFTSKMCCQKGCIVPCETFAEKMWTLATPSKISVLLLSPRWSKLKTRNFSGWQSFVSKPEGKGHSFSTCICCTWLILRRCSYMQSVRLNGSTI